MAHQDPSHPFKVRKHSRFGGYGWSRDLPDARDFLYAAPPPVLKKGLPEHVDLRAKCPPVYDQGQLGSCTANAIGAAVEFDQKKQKQHHFTPSRLFIYYNERAIEGTVNQDSGAQIRDGIKVVAKLGSPPEADWPYHIQDFTKKPPQPVYEEAKKELATSYFRVAQTLTQLQGCLAEGFPIVFGFTVYDSFESNAVAETGMVPMPLNSESVLGGHAVLAVGYDTKTRQFLVRNSWGKAWGKDGYCMMPFEYLASPQLASDFWTIRLVA